MENFFKFNSISDYLLNLESLYGSKISHSYKIKNQWIEYTYKQTIDSAFNLMSTLETAGISRGDKLLIISRNRPEFCATFFGCSLLGAIAIPIDPRMSLKDLQFIYDHSDPSAIITLAPEDNLLAEQIARQDKKVTIIESTLLSGKSENIRIVKNPSGFNADDPALIIYTSGTTSRPKGVLISFNNLFSQVETISQDTFKIKNDLKLLSILPLNHLFEFTVGLLIPFSTGGEVCYSNSLLPSAILESLKERKIKEMICVPLFLQMLKKGIEAKMKERPLIEKYFKVGLFLTSFLKSQFLRKLYFLPIHLSFGGKFRKFISGGSSLSAEVEGFFDQLGFTVYQGYGLTETSPIATTNNPKKNKKGSVGNPIRGVEIRLDKKSGEILIKGPNVMKGYYKDQELTNEVIDRDGWFYSGDVGSIDEKGFLTITGRIKELIVLSNGKKIAPYDVEEELMKDNRFLKEACVIGMKISKGSMKGVEEVCAVVVPHDDYIHLEDKMIHELLKERIKEISDYKRPSRIVVQRKEFEKTSTLKTKRLLVKAQLEVADQNILSQEQSLYPQETPRFQYVSIPEYSSIEKS